MNAKKVNEIFKRFAEANPAPQTELQYRNHFELLIAVILSAQATDKSVNKATPALFEAAPTPKAMRDLGETGLIEYIKSIGLYRSKAKHIIQACEMLVTLHHSVVPSTREALEALPGVGRKTANVVLNTAFGEATVAVDTHIFRVANRTGLAKGKTPNAVETGLIKVIPKAYLRDAHHWLVLHGRYVCTAKKPQCPTCLINDCCEYNKKTADDGLHRLEDLSTST